MKAKLEQIGNKADEIIKGVMEDKSLNYKKRSTIRWAMWEVEIQVEKALKALE